MLLLIGFDVDFHVQFIDDVVTPGCYRDRHVL